MAIICIDRGRAVGHEPLFDTELGVVEGAVVHVFRIELNIAARYGNVDAARYVHGRDRSAEDLPFLARLSFIPLIADASGDADRIELFLESQGDVGVVVVTPGCRNNEAVDGR